MKIRMKSVTAAIGALTLTAMATAPALAAPVVSQASATALTISVAGTGQNTGTTEASNDGSGEVKTGEANPPIAVLGGQDLLDIGVLAQDAQAQVKNKSGVSAACSGIAGDGASIAEVGESECLTPGDPIGVSLANLDLTGAVLIDPASALGALAPLNAIVPQLVGPLTKTISDGLKPLGATGLGGTLGTVQARCTAGPGDALFGTANIADSKLQLDVAGTSVDLVNFPANPPPNTKVLTDLDVVVDTLLDALRIDLNTTLDAQAAPLQLIIDPIQDQIVDVLIAQIAPQLAPLEDNILDITLNRQIRTKGSIDVTALVIDVLPAAKQFTDAPLVNLDIARVTCGPNGRVAPPTTPPSNPPNTPDNPDNPSNPGNPGNPDVPTFVDAGVSTGPDNALLGGALGGGLVLLTGTAGLIGYRRFSVH